MKKMIKTLSVLALALALAASPIAGAAPAGGSIALAAKKVTPSLNKKSVSLDKGGKFTLKVKGGKAKSYKSSNPKAVSVSKKGVIKALKDDASAKVTVTLTTGKKLTCKVSVNPIELSADELDLSIDETEKLTISGTSAKPVFNVDNDAVATVSDTGVVTGRSAGEATVTVVVSGKTLQCRVSVSEDIYEPDTGEDDEDYDSGDDDDDETDDSDDSDDGDDDEDSDDGDDEDIILARLDNEVQTLD